MTKRGLYLGKFTPLHKGHEYCIETAREEVDELVVLIYDEPEVTDIPLRTRYGWLHKLYSPSPAGDKADVEVRKAYAAPTELGYDDHLKALHEKYVIDTVGRDFDVFFSSEPYGEHMASALDAEDYRIDEERDEIPISATAIRASIGGGYFDAIRPWVSDVVYRDLVTNVVVLGGTSTGKTTLTEALADHFDTVHMPEYGEEYWQENADENGELSQLQLAELARDHLIREEQKLQEANQYLFTDTNAITTGLFSKWYHGVINAQLQDMMNRSINRYDLVLLADDDIPFEPAPGRGGKTGRETLQRMNEDWLNSHGVPYYRVSGSVAERVNQVSYILDNFNKWDWEQKS